MFKALFVNLVHKFALTSLLMRTQTLVFVFSMVTVGIMIISWRLKGFNNAVYRTNRNWVSEFILKMQLLPMQ